MLEAPLFALSLLPLLNYPLLEKFPPGTRLDVEVVLGKVSSPQEQAASRQTPHHGEATVTKRINLGNSSLAPLPLGV